MHEKSYFDHKSLSKGVEGGDKEQNTYFEVISCFVKRIYLLTYVVFLSLSRSRIFNSHEDKFTGEEPRILTYSLWAAKVLWRIAPTVA